MAGELKPLLLPIKWCTIREKKSRCPRNRRLSGGAVLADRYNAQCAGVSESRCVDFWHHVTASNPPPSRKVRGKDGSPNPVWKSNDFSLQFPRSILPCSLPSAIGTRTPIRVRVGCSLLPVRRDLGRCVSQLPVRGRCRLLRVNALY